MLKKTCALIFAVCSVAFLSGCVTAKTYMINKPRVDQEIPGMPQQGAVKTRKVMVVEIIEKDKPLSAALEAVQDDTVDGMPVVSAEEKNFDLPPGVAAPVPAENLQEPVEYVVTKDDTLQKIAKKVYGSYNKWTKIYDANRQVLKDPNFLKPGTRIMIPPLEAPQGIEE